MLDKWQKDILDSISASKNLPNGVYAKEDCLLANAILFELVNSYVWRHEFKGAQLIAKQDTSGQSWIDFPAYDDPNTQNGLRYEERINCLDWKYFASYDNESLDETWHTTENGNLEIITETSQLPWIAEVKRKLSENDYYRLLLEKDPVKQANNLRDLEKITYTIYEDLDYHELLLQTKMYRYSGNPLGEIFGHVYTKSCDNRIMVVAANALGPIGLAALFDYSKSPSMRNPDRLSLSYVSVSPSFRNKGISKELLRKCLEYAQQNGKFITRTTSSPFGEKAIFKSFGEYAKDNFSAVPFVKNEEIQLACILYNNSDFCSLNSKSRLKLIIEFLRLGNSYLERTKEQLIHATHHDINEELLLKQFIPTINKYARKTRSDSLEML